MNTSPLHEVTEADVAYYEENGFVCLRQMFDSEWVERMRGAIEDVYGQGPQFMKMNPDGTPGKFWVNLYVWNFNDDFRAFAFESPAAQIASKLMKSSRINMISDVIFHKAPKSPHPTPWHQDQPYWFVDGWQVCGLWVALDAVTLESGAVEYIKGSHKWGKWYEPESFDVTGKYGPFRGEDTEEMKAAMDDKTSDGFEPMPNISAERDKYEIVSFDTEPGDCIVNHFLTVHSARGNPTQRNRRAIAFRFAGDDATFAVRKAEYRLKPHADPKLKPGDPFPPDHPLYPQVWPPRRDAHQAA
ncbi:MAG: phytanoyl-CoA dioxygenase family protein [Candidatus Binatia bacterium]